MPQYPVYNYANPYGGFQQQMPNYQPMDRLAQIQQNYTQTIPQQFNQPQQMMGLNGEIVDSIDVVKAKNVDMTGNPTFYPKADLSEIYIKRLQPDGTSRVDVYQRVIPENEQANIQQPVNMDMLNGMFVQLRQDLLNEISGVKELVGTLAPVTETSAPTPKTTRGGSKS